MLAKTAAIVLGSVKYGDSSVILKTYSREYGVISFIAGGVRGKKGNVRSAVVQVLNQLEIVFYPNSRGELKRIKEVSVPKAYQNLMFDPFRNCISMFLAESLTHFIREEEANHPLYEYLSNSLFLLDKLESGVANFHLVFLYRLSSYLGFELGNSRALPYFDLLAGSYEAYEPPHVHVLKGEVLEHWKKLAETSLHDLQELKLNGNQRLKMLEAMLTYYRLHLRDFGELRSLDVLHAVLH